MFFSVGGDFRERVGEEKNHLNAATLEGWKPAREREKPRRIYFEQRKVCACVCVLVYRWGHYNWVQVFVCVTVRLCEMYKQLWSLN